MTVLGHCKHRYSSVSTCGLTVLATEYGPGHSSPPVAAHYPVVRSSESITAAGSSPSAAVMAAGPSIGAIERFWSKVDKSGDCWEWTAARNADGYGKFKWDGRDVRAPRFAWLITNGAIPDGLRILHSCDNPPCVRPNHLFLGTDADNTHDSLAKGRLAFGDRNGTRTHPESRPRGERHHAARLTSADVLDIRARLALGERPAHIAVAFGVGFTAITNIRAGITWGWLQTPTNAPDLPAQSWRLGSTTGTGSLPEPVVPPRGSGRRLPASAG